MWIRVFAIIFQLIKLIMLEKFVLTILKLNWNQRLGQKRTKLNICHHMLTSSTQLQNRSKNENVFKMSKDEKCTCKACKNTVFHCQICKFVGFLLPSSSWLLKLPIGDLVTSPSHCFARHVTSLNQGLSSLGWKTLGTRLVWTWCYIMNSPFLRVTWHFFLF